MRPDMLDILACPVCKGSLTLTAEAEAGGEVLTGHLHCGRCNHDYPITDGIPNLLPPAFTSAT